MKKNLWSLTGLKKSKSKKPTKTEIFYKSTLVYFGFLFFLLEFFTQLFKNFFYLKFLSFFYLDPSSSVKKNTFSLESFFYSLSFLTFIFLLILQIFNLKIKTDGLFTEKQEKNKQEYNLFPNLLVKQPTNNFSKIKLKNASEELDRTNIFLKKQPNDPQLLKNKIILNQYLNNNSGAQETFNYLNNSPHLNEQRIEH